MLIHPDGGLSCFNVEYELFPAVAAIFKDHIIHIAVPYYDYEEKLTAAVPVVTLPTNRGTITTSACCFATSVLLATPIAHLASATIIWGAAPF